MLSQIIKDFDGQVNAKGESRCYVMRCPCGEEFIKLKHNVRENTICVKCSLARKSSVPRNLYVKLLETKIKSLTQLLSIATEYLPPKLKQEVREELSKDVKNVLINFTGLRSKSLRPDNSEVPAVNGTEDAVQSGSVQSDIREQESVREVQEGEEQLSNNP